MSDVTLTLITQQGPFVFSGAEVPEKIAFGGEQMLMTHKLVGGLRVIDAMGPDDQALSWSGWFLGSTNPNDQSDNPAPLPTGQSATGRARFLDYVRRSGLPCTLTWGEFKYQVVVSKFTADYEKPYKIPFSITCEVVQDSTKRISSIQNTSPTDLVNQDSSTLGTLASGVNDPTLSTMVSNAQSALSSVTGAAKPIASGLVSLTAGGGSGIAASLSASIPSALAASVSSNVTSALNSAISGANAALGSLQSYVAGQINVQAGIVASIPSIGTLNPTQAVVQQAAAMTAQANAAVSLSTYTQIGNVVARLQVNLALVANPGGTKQVVTGGGNFYQEAAQAYGDATRWTDIAQASGLSDPMTPNFNKITIPA